MTMNKDLIEDNIATITISANGARGGFDVEILHALYRGGPDYDIVEDLRHFMNLQDVARFIREISQRSG